MQSTIAEFDPAVWVAEAEARGYGVYLLHTTRKHTGAVRHRQEAIWIDIANVEDPGPESIPAKLNIDGGAGLSRRNQVALGSYLKATGRIWVSPCWEGAAA